MALYVRMYICVCICLCVSMCVPNCQPSMHTENDLERFASHGHCFFQFSQNFAPTENMFLVFRRFFFPIFFSPTTFTTLLGFFFLLFKGYFLIQRLNSLLKVIFSNWQVCWSFFHLFRFQNFSHCYYRWAF